MAKLTPAFQLIFTIFMGAFLVSLNGCSQPSTDRQPMVIDVHTQEIAGPSEASSKLSELKNAHLLGTVDGSAAAAPAIEGQVTFQKSEILNRDFLFGSDLQYSSISDDDDAMLVQATSATHVPARFSILDDYLRLIAIQDYLYQSDIDHPQRIIHEFKIIKQDDQTVTVSVREASPLLSTIMANATGATDANAKAGLAIHNSWMRTVEYIPQGNYLLMQSTVELANGSIAEFMESVFPRETLVPKDAKPLLGDDALEPIAKRYRILANDPIYLDLAKGRTKTQVAPRYLLDPKTGVIEWYVTPNVPAQYLPALKAGVEGWNRYSQKIWGRDFIHFNGVLPAGVKIGDPRYNVINWDSVPDASAAYESQASDPVTGIQSHALIYLPYAWVKIGQDYWKSYSLTQEDTPSKTKLRQFFKQSSLAGSPVQVRCFDEIDQSFPLEALRTPEVFAYELLKQVLFHEIGHSLGFAHNFKGSLSFNPDDPTTAFSTSIMDYNQYELEDQVFDSKDSSSGPLLEYDRQIFSQLYNKGADVAATDAVLPACDDDESDSFKGGVDPFCIRYDAGNDPTAELIRTRQLIEDPTAHIGRAVSLVAALKKTAATLGDPATVTDKAAIETHLSDLADEGRGIAKYYLASGAQSLNYMVRANIRSLYTFRSDLLPTPIDEKALRQRVADSLTYVMDLTSLNEAAHATYTDISTASEAWLKSTAWFKNQTTMATTEKDNYVTTALKDVRDLENGIGTDLLPAVRTKILSVLVMKDDAPFYFLVDGSGKTDYEKFAIDLLKHVAIDPLDGDVRDFDERSAAITSLKTFKAIYPGQKALGDVEAQIKKELRDVKTADDRTALRKLLALFD